MVDKIRNFMSSDNGNIREKLFVIICIESVVASIMSLIECLAVRAGWPIYGAITIFIAIIIWAVISIVNGGDQEMPILAVSIWMCMIVFPLVFFTCGGVHSGSNGWLALGIIYVFMVYRGRPLKILATLIISIDIACYVAAYNFPSLVTPLASELSVYMDSALGMLAVGITAGFIFSFRRKGYGRESAMAIKQRNELDRLNASRERFYANFSHEIRNPINSIVGLNELNIRQIQDPEIMKNSQAIGRSGRLLLSIVNDIMDLSQIAGDRMVITPAPYDVQSAIASLIELIGQRAKDKGLELKLEVDPALPKILVGDQRRITQVLLNLLTNAVKYTDKGYVKMSIVSNKEGNDTVRLRISVSDTGIGIEKENLAHLFDTYSQFDRVANSGIEGNGLGLPIAYEFTRLMGGDIKVDSVYGEGSTFTVEFNQKYIGNDLIEGTTYEQISETGAKQSEYVRSFEASKARILVVDDDAQNRSIIKGLLKDTKVEIAEAGSGEEALKLTAENEYHVILVDYMMPGMSGTELLDEIREQSGGLCRKSRIIALTGAILDRREHNKALYEFDLILTKPVEYTVLENAIADNIPEELIEYRVGHSEETTGISIPMVAPKRKRRIRITTDSSCDLPRSVLDEHDIGLMNLYIRTKKGRYKDIEEIDSLDLMGQLTESRSDLIQDGATVNEYQRFFRNELETSEEIIHLSFSSKIGNCYNHASEAAEAFSHVRVIDSCLVSAGLGLLAIISTEFVDRGLSADEICANIDKIKQHIDFSFVLPSAGLASKNKLMSKRRARVYDSLNIHPAAHISHGAIKQIRAYKGEMKQIIKHHIKMTMLLSGRMDNRVPVILTHAGLTPGAQDQMLREMRENLPEKSIMLTRASVTTASYTGIGAVGVAYLHHTPLLNPSIPIKP